MTINPRDEDKVMLRLPAGTRRILKLKAAEQMRSVNNLISVVVLDWLAGEGATTKEKTGQ